MNLSIIIPCYNEEEGLDNLFSHLNPVLDKLSLNWNLELVFVDDGSTDRTNKLLHKLFGNHNNVKIIKHEKNKNLGGAMRTGFANCSGDVIVTMDSDCTYNPENIPTMLSLLDENTDIVTASPYHPQGGIRNVPKYRLLLSRSISLFYRILTGAKIYTFTALFRAHKREVIENVRFNSNNFLATAEMLINAINKGYSVKEYPLVLNARQFGESKMKLFMVIRSHANFVFKLTGRKLLGK